MSHQTRKTVGEVFVLVEAIQQQLTEIRERLLGPLNGEHQELAPLVSLAALARTLNELATRIEADATDLRKQDTDPRPSSMHELGNTVRKLSSDVGDVKSTVDNLVESVGSKLTSELKPLYDSTDATKRVVDNVANDVGQLRGQVKTTADGIVDSVGSKLTSGLKPLYDSTDATKRVVDNVANDVGTLKGEVKTTADGIVESVGGKLATEVTPLRLAVGDILTKLESLSALVQKNLLTSGTASASRIVEEQIKVSEKERSALHDLDKALRLLAQMTPSGHPATPESAASTAASNPSESSKTQNKDKRDANLIEEATIAVKQGRDKVGGAVTMRLSIVDQIKASFAGPWWQVLLIMGVLLVLMFPHRYPDLFLSWRRQAPADTAKLQRESDYNYNEWVRCREAHKELGELSKWVSGEKERTENTVALRACLEQLKLAKDQGQRCLCSTPPRAPPPQVAPVVTPPERPVQINIHQNTNATGDGPAGSSSGRN